MMPVSIVWLGAARTFALVSCALSLLGLATLAHAQQNSPTYSTIETAGPALDQLEATLKQDRLSTDALIKLGSVAI